MSSTEFYLLEESSRLELLSSRLNITFETSSGFGQGLLLDESYGAYICVLKIISDTDPSEKSYIVGTLEITQEAY